MQAVFVRYNYILKPVKYSVNKQANKNFNMKMI